MIRTTIFIYFFLIINPCLLASTFSNNGVKLSNKNSIYEIVKIPESKISIGQWALIIAKEFNPTVEISMYQKKLNEMAKEIIRMLAGRTKDMDKFLAVKTYLYESGQWNDYKPYTYDLNDLLGENLEQQLISSYLDTRKGNCVSMPTLFLTLMELVDPGIKFYGVKAPLHLFCRLKDRQTGDVWNIETTNGGNPARNQWYIDQLHINDDAIKNNLYLKDLSKKEFLAELISPFISKERRIGNFEKALKYTELVLKLSPSSDLGLVSKGALLAELGYKIKESKNSFTKEEQNKIKEYEKESLKYINKAKLLGWRQQNSMNREKYLNSIRQQKNK